MDPTTVYVILGAAVLLLAALGAAIGIGYQLREGEVSSLGAKIRELEAELVATRTALQRERTSHAFGMLELKNEERTADALADGDRAHARRVLLDDHDPTDQPPSSP